MRPLLFVTAAAFAAAAVQAQPSYANYHGAWQGPVLFNLWQERVGSQDAPAVHAGTLEIASDGGVSGQVPGAGCRLAGSAADFVSAANASLDITFDGCRDTRFNGRYSGKLISNPVLNYASLRMSFTRSLDSGTAQVSAILRR